MGYYISGASKLSVRARVNMLGSVELYGFCYKCLTLMLQLESSLRE